MMKCTLIISLFFYFVVNVLAQNVYVQRVIDGDTFVDENGESYRLLGINAPELSDVGGEEAKLFLDSLLRGEMIFAVKDYEYDTIDIYRRHLCYAYTENGILVNELLLRKQLAKLYLKYPFSLQEQFIKVTLGNSKVSDEKIISANEEKESIFFLDKKKLILILLLGLIVIAFKYSLYD